jgi:hypothetical protein
VTSAGELLDQHVQLVRLLMERDRLTASAALAKAGALIPDEDRNEVLRRWERQTSTTIQVLAPIDLSELGGPRSWYDDWDPSQGYYWRRQRWFMAQQLRRHDYEIDSLDQASNRVLSHLEHPAHPEPFLVRGLVIGYVQSGKTANFSALIAKAADAGYKIVIVLSGLHNTLRQQTQRRLQRDLGSEDGVGVGLPEPGRQWVWMTNAEAWGDFNPGAVDASLLQGNEQVILVVKKNKSRLERLLTWMRGRVPGHVAVLVIDDEADQASINTGDNRSPREVSDLAADDYDGDEPSADEFNPSAINLAIRKLLRRFERCAYVAYTATPFANALINPMAQDTEGGEDLFPKDFILSLPPPPGDGYVGPERLFGRDRLPGDAEGADTEDGLDVIEFVPSHEVDLLVPPRGERDGFIPSVPPSLAQALMDFVLASAGRLQRSSRDVPCTMLVHTDMRRAVQNPLASDILRHLAHFRQRWMYDRDELRPDLVDRWEHGFRPVIRSVDVALDVAFDVIEDDVDRLLRDGIPVRVLNSDYPDNIDFDAEPTLKAVLVGGNKLSRGVTVEGLLVSYYVRETLYYDTLLQMGRWFGYRGSYIDLTRLYSTELLVRCFHDLATAEEELRRYVAVYERRKLKPTALAPRIRKHPMMLVTAKNKMQDAREFTVSYDGKFRQTFHFPFDDVDLLAGNLDAARRFLSSLGGPVWEGTRPSWASVDPRAVLGFLEDFHTIDEDPIDPTSIAQYIHLQLEHGELVRWRVLLCAARQAVKRLGTEKLGVVGAPDIPLLERSRKKLEPTSCGVITDKDDETHGLNPEQLQAGADAFETGEFPDRAHAIRAQRPSEEGLLLVYPISKYSQPRRSNNPNKPQMRMSLFDDPERGVTVVGYALSFPYSRSPASVEYISGPERPRRYQR